MINADNSFEAEKREAARLTASQIGEGFTTKGFFPYTGKDGSPMFFIVRLEHPNKPKWIRPIHFNGGGAGKLGLPAGMDAPGSRPLYRLPGLIATPPDAEIYITEGEQKADVLTTLGFIATTSSNGAQSPHKTDWKPLEGHTVIIWPDHDEPGRRYAETVSGLCQTAGAASVEIVDVAPLGLPKGGDVVDFVKACKAEGRTDAEIVALIKSLARLSPITAADDGADFEETQALSGETKALVIGKVILSYPQLLQLTIPESKMILEWLKEGGLAMVYAPRGLGKTFFGLALAVAIASGKPFMRWLVKCPCGVLYIDGEMSLAAMRDRLRGFIVQPLAAPLLTLSHEIFYENVEKDLRLTDEGIQKVILSYLDDNPEIRVLIVDNLSSLTSIREDKGDDWRESFFPFMLKCRRRRVAVLLVHHAGKNGDQRGTGAREDALDITIKLSKADEDNRNGAHFRVDFTKARGVYGDTVKPFTAKLATDADGFFTWDIQNVEENLETRLITLIRATDGIHANEAAEELGVSKGTISKIKKRLMDKGILKKSRGYKPLQLAESGDVTLYVDSLAKQPKKKKAAVQPLDGEEGEV